MTIKRYNEKRNFKATPEPAGKTEKSTARELLFVIQKHEASHLHYDFRLELEGVMKSWAVPKGPSLNPEDKRLAMHVEDHPMSYRTFEGIIPEGNYGAGTVMVWDQGSFYADKKLDKKANEKLLLEGYRKGKMTFQMKGKKLRGEFALVKMRGKNAQDNAWLLLKHNDAYTDRDNDIRDEDKSAASNRTMQAIADNRKAKVWASNKARATKARAIKTSATKTRASKTLASKTPVTKTRVKSPAKKTAPAKKRATKLAQAAIKLGGKKTALPEISGPQLATLGDEPFDRDGWAFEIKWDGYRALGYNPPNDGIALVSRNGHSFDDRFPAIRAALATLPCSAIVDGEVVALDKEGHSSFGSLQNSAAGKVNLVYYLFDLLYVDGVDVRGLPLRERKKLLQQLLQGCDEQLRYSDHIETNGLDFFAAAKQGKLEGIIAKDLAATYQTGIRTRHWLKIKIEQRQEFIIAGYTAPRRSRSDVGSLVLAYYGTEGNTSGKLRFAGHVGSGMDADMRAELKEKLDKLAIKKSPFAERTPTNEPATWVKPELVCEVRYTEKTADCQLRHPVFLGLRTDKPAKDIHWDVALQSEAAAASAETSDKAPKRKRSGKKAGDTPSLTRAATAKTPAMARYRQRKADAGNTATFSKEAPERDKFALSIDGREVAVSHPKRVYYPEMKLSKVDVIDYYRSVSDYLLPYLKDRPFVLHRFPAGIDQQNFYQKDNEPEELPAWIKSVGIRAESTGEEVNYVVCQDEATLVYLVNLGCIEMNPWNSRVRNIDKPDWMVLDLDPVDIGFTKVVEVARVIHDMFEAIGIPHYCKTSGKRGLHIAVPLHAKYSNDTVREMAESVAQLVHHEMPGSTSIERSPSKRRKKIYLDYLQNGRGKTLVAPYSLRPVDYAGISAPLHWDEVTPKLDPRDFNIHTIIERIESEGDLWEAVLKESINLKAILQAA